MNALANFVFDAEDGTPHALRSVMIDGEPWFVAVDLCAVLDIKNPTQAMDRLDDDEKAMFNIGQRETNIVNEAGLYSLILGSRKPEAKRFKKWVTGQVLPSIRKTGAYVEPGAQLGQGAHHQVQFLSHGADILVAADRTFRSAMRSARSAGLPLPRALRRANEICLARTGIDMLTELDAHDQLNPTPASPAHTPGHIQAHMVEFLAALAQGQVHGAVLPMLSTQLYRLYVWWCRGAGHIPASQMRFAALMVQAGAYRSVRKRYLNAAAETVGPMAFAMSATEPPPSNQFEPEWLGQAVHRANQLLAGLGA